MPTEKPRFPNRIAIFVAAALAVVSIALMCLAVTLDVGIVYERF